MSIVICHPIQYPHLKGSFANVNDENLSLVSSQICNRFFQCIQQQTFATVENKAAEFPSPIRRYRFHKRSPTISKWTQIWPLARRISS